MYNHRVVFAGNDDAEFLTKNDINQKATVKESRDIQVRYDIAD